MEKIITLTALQTRGLIKALTEAIDEDGAPAYPYSNIRIEPGGESGTIVTVVAADEVWQVQKNGEVTKGH